MQQRFSRERTMHEVRTRTATVSAVRQLSSHLTRVTLSGGDLSDFVSTGPTDHVKVVLPEPQNIGALAATQDITHSRDYTVVAVRHRDDGTEIDLDFVTHSGDGIAATWAKQAQVGDSITLRGPRASAALPSDASRAILVADESAFPAAANWLAAFAAIPVTGLFLTAYPDSQHYFEAAPSTEPLHGQDLRQPRSEHALHFFSGSNRFELAFNQLRESVIDEGTFLFLAGESSLMVPLRTYLRRELGLPAAQASVHGYWKHGEAGRDHHAPLDPSEPEAK